MQDSSYFTFVHTQNYTKARTCNFKSFFMWFMMNEMREIFIKIKNCLAATANNYNKKKRQAEYPQAEDERITTAVQLSFDKKLCSLMTCSMIKMKTHNMRVHKISLHRWFSPSFFFVSCFVGPSIAILCNANT